ncbi:hypothetical protein AAFC00_001183 [Neodothiora populina]|uniref:Uncharacterized protein n=1 Tax=Neodothiora populina TaxID=2781224 RepID=A0ABR3PP24_9PEZI
MAPTRKSNKRKTKTANLVDPISSKQIIDDVKLPTDYNPRTGRPIRRSAGRKSLQPSYVNPDDAMSDEDEDVFVDDFDDNVRVAKKRKRSPTPPMTPRRLIDDTEPLDEVVASRESNSLHDSTHPVSFTFHIPPGYSGPFVVNLDANLLANLPNAMSTKSSLQSAPHTPSLADSGYASKSRSSSESNSSRKLFTHSSPKRTGKAGFLSLPPELRNQVYRLLFVTPDKLDFGHPRNFGRSSHFLRTCKQVHEEGKSILYSENTFYFQASRETRTRRFESGAYQIAYKDIRYFLSALGPTNVGLIRHIIFIFEDLVPSLNPRLKSIDDRRFTSNEDLYAALRLLGDSARLQTLKLSFQGRRWFFMADEDRFSSYLVRIKADSVAFIDWPDHYYNAESRTPKLAEKELTEQMVRAVPMYTSEGKSSQKGKV